MAVLALLATLAAFSAANDDQSNTSKNTPPRLLEQHDSQSGSYFVHSAIPVSPENPYTNPETPSIITFQIYWDSNDILSITFEDDFAPRDFFLNGKHTEVENETLLSRIADTRFLPSSHFFQRETTFETSPKYTGRSDFSLALEKIIPPDELNKLEYRQTFLYQKGEITSFVATRNAAEHRHYGEKLKLVAGLKTGNIGQIVGGFDRKHTSIDTEFRTRRLASVRSLAESGAPSTRGGSKTALQDKLLELLFVNHSRQYLPQNTNTLINFLLASSVKAEDPQSVISLRLGKIADAVNEEIDDKFSDKELIFLDPYLRGPYIDQVAWIDEEPALLDKTFILLGNLTDKEARFSAAHHIGSMGFSFNFRAFKFFNSTLLGTGPPEVNAAFGAHWGLPVKDDDVLAVVNVLKSSLDFPTRWNAIEVLILLDEVEKVPQKALQEWDRVFLYSGETSTRLRKLAYLAQTKSGRAHMADLLQHAETPPDVAKTITSVLAGHIDATEELSRFDAISKEEIAQLREAMKRFDSRQ